VGLWALGWLCLFSRFRSSSGEAQEEIGGEVNESEMCESEMCESEKRDGMECDAVVSGEASGGGM
jgi:hypothetical protein